MGGSQNDEERGPRRFGFVLSGATLFAFLIALFATSGMMSRYECAGNLEPVSEPAGWRTWPKEAGSFVGDSAGGGKLFGYSFRYLRPMGAKYPGFGGTELTDPTLCPHSQISLDSWFTGDASWMRDPGELSIHREPNRDRQVISGIGVNADGTTRPVEFVTAFRRVVSPRTLWVPHPAPPALLPLWLGVLAGVACSVAGARRKISLKTARRRGVSLIGVALVVAAGVELLQAMSEAMI